MVSRRRYFREWDIPVLIIIVLVLAGTGLVSAHAPLGVGSNEDIANATLIGNPEKSFVLYTELHDSGEAQYYRFPMHRGEILFGSLQIPAPGSMIPDLAIIGPGIGTSGKVPSFVEIPAGSGAMLVPGEPPGKPAYEPFTPQPIYEASHFNITVPRDGDYYIAVFGPQGGKYSLAPGFVEQFTASEWLSIPVSVLSIYLWEGQSIMGIFAPLVIVLIGGLTLVYLHGRRGFTRDPVGWLVIVSGLLYVGGAAITAMQTVHSLQLTGYSPEVFLTLVFIAGPLILGIFAIRIGIRMRGPDFFRADGVKLVLIGLMGLAGWAGLITGPVLALVCGTLILAKHTRKSDPARPDPSPGV